MHRHLLLIEDEDSGEHIKSYITSSIKDINVYWSRNRHDAINTIHDNPNIKVIIFDQKIKTDKTIELGSNIMQDIISIRPEAVGIMLSGLASPDELYKSINAKTTHKYINKGDAEEFAQLPEHIIEAFNLSTLKSIAACPATTERQIYKESKLSLPFQQTTAYIVNSKIVNHKTYNEEDWEDIFILHAGQEKTEEHQTEKKMNVRIINSTESNENINLHLDGKALSTAIKLDFEKNIKEKNDSAIEHEKREIRKQIESFKLPPIPDDTSKKYITCSIVQQAQISNKYAVTLRVDCSCCNNSQMFTYTVLVPTARHAMRRINTFSDGTKEVITIQN